MNRVLITGANGMLGSDFLKIWCRHATVTGIDISDCNITSSQSVNECFDAVRPDMVVHCAAYTNVDGAQDHEDTAHSVNVQGTENIVQSARRIGAEVVYISTDFVFDGKKSVPYNEEDSANPLSVYGKTKYEGERIIRELLPAHYIVRISWLYGRSGSNFVYTIRNAARERPELQVVNDQFGTPTFTLDVAHHLWRIVRRGSWGTWHLSGEGAASWYDFAREVLRLYDIKTPVKPVTSDEFPRPAPRPAYSVMANQRYFNECGGKMPDWKKSLADFVNNYAL